MDNIDILPESILDYAENHSEEESELLKKLHRETYAKILMPKMISGHLQGRILSMFSKMIRPKHILEIGTFTGYSAICLSEGLVPDGKLITIEINEELEPVFTKYFKEAGIADQIKYYIGNALDILPELNINFDLVYLDADKTNYSSYFDLIFNKLNPGGVIIADNVLWYGKVATQAAKNDKDTQCIQEFNRKVHNDSRVENILLPIRDGLMVLRKK